MPQPPRSGALLRPAALFGAAFVATAAGADDLAESLWRAQSGEAARTYCAGGYVDPPLPALVDLDGVHLQANSIQARLGASIVASGAVTVRQGGRLLATEELRVDEAAGVATAPLPVRLSEPGLHVRGASAEVGLAGTSALLRNAQFVATDLHLRGAAESLARDADAMRLRAASLTRCAPGDESWRLRAAELRVDEDAGVATARHVRLALGRVPVFYAPYARFPVGDERASGLLFPDIGYDGDDGVDVSLPYYLNLAPNYDATLTGRLVGDRGAGVEGEFRHAGMRSRSDVRGAVLFADDDYDGLLSRADRLAAGGAAADFAPADRWLLDASHAGRFGRFFTSLDYAAVSDNDYLRDLGGGRAGGARLALERRFEAGYANGDLLARLWAQGVQRLEPGADPHRRLPEASVSYARRLGGPLEFSADASWSSFRAAGHGDSAQRLHLAPRLGALLRETWGVLDIAAGAYHTRYDQGGGPSGDRSQRRNIGFASADGTLFFERELADGRVHTLEPRMRYLYQGYADQRRLPRFAAAELPAAYSLLFRDNRFAGIDRIGDANQITVGVASRLLAAASGRELLSAGIGAVARLADSRVALDDGAPLASGTAWAGELRAALGAMQVAAAAAWDAEGGGLDEAGGSVSYRAGPRRIVNVGVRRLADRRAALAGARQTDVSFHWRLAARWNAFGRWNHDWQGGRTIERFAGIEYASCCLSVKALWHETDDVPRNWLPAWRRKDRGLQLQVVLRGLAGFGAGFESRLERGIKGYRTEEEAW